MEPVHDPLRAVPPHGRRDDVAPDFGGSLGPRQQILEQLSGDDYEVYMEKNVLRPLGMSRSYFDLTPYHLQRFRSHSYEVAPAKAGGAVADLGPDFDTGITVSNGGLNAPLGDMARYLAFLLAAVPPDSDAANVLARASLEQMWQPVLPMPAKAQDPHQTLAILDHLGSPATMAMAGPRFFGFVIGGSLPVTLAANWLAGAWDQNSAMANVTPSTAKLLEDLDPGENGYTLTVMERGAHSATLTLAE